MTYELKGGEYVKGGKLFGWTGQACKKCNGSGERTDAMPCESCGRTGDEHGLMPVQPADLPPDTE